MNKEPRTENRLVGLGFLTFAANVFSQGFHNTSVFWVVGGLGILIGFWVSGSESSALHLDNARLAASGTT
jgi:uncharacterized membrane protein